MVDFLLNTLKKKEIVLKQKAREASLKTPCLFYRILLITVQFIQTDFNYNLIIKQNNFYVLIYIFVGYSTNLRSRASYIAVGVWCLMAVVLANAYAGTLFSFLTVTKLEPIVNSLEELANSKQLQLLIQDRTVLADRLLVHN